MTRSLRLPGTCLLVVALGASLSGRTEAQPRPGDPEKASYILKAARVITVTGETLEPGHVWIEEGKIRQVAQELELPEGVEVRDLGKRTVLPGLIDAHSHLGGFLELTETATASTPGVRAADALDPFHDDIDVALRDGVTAFLLAPRGENTLGGVCAVVKPGVDGRGARVVEDEVALKLSFAGHSLRGDRRPTSRAGAVALLREEMARARTDDGALELRKALDGEWPVLIDARDHGEIATALRTMKEFGLRGALVHASWASETADEIGATGASCIVGPLGPGDDRRVLEGPAALEAAGVKVAFGSDAPAGTRDALLVTAALAVRHGMSREGALRALTIHAAEIAGVPDLMGSIEAGKSADLLVIEGDPLDLSSRVHEVIIDGKTAFQRGKPKEAP